ncbi:hypothetical protein [Streptomyces sp. NPDC047061]|uniref:hypothetical protein n=1 Tax=Streptomyces sp. NPDC047061 TaxID=3154605 RepID=UPI0033FAF003
MFVRKTAVALTTVLAATALLLAATGSSTAADRIRQADRIRPGGAAVSDTDNGGAAADLQILASGRIRGGAVTA